MDTTLKTFYSLFCKNNDFDRGLSFDDDVPANNDEWSARNIYNLTTFLCIELTVI